MAGVENGSRGSKCVAGVRNMLAGVRNGSKLGCRGSKMGAGVRNGMRVS